MISLRQLSKRFGSHPAADELALEVGVSETLVLLGTSGGGKTTTLKMTSGLVEPDAGSGQIGGESRAASARHEWRRKIGYVIHSE